MDNPEFVLPLAATDADEQFADLVRRQSRFVFRVAYSVSRNAQDAEDAVQETFWKLYRNRAWQHISDEKAFLARAAWRVAVSRCKHREEHPAGADPVCPQANPEAAALQSDWDAIVHRLVNALPQELRQPLALSALDELSSPQIALVLGIPEGTVRTRLMRAREILKRKLAAYAK